MIIRYAINCETCQHHHVLRVGIGQESYQQHSFQCRNCGEMITVGVRLDFQERTDDLVCELKCTKSTEIFSDEIVNLDATFVVPDELQNRSDVFTSLIFGPKLLDSGLFHQINPESIKVSDAFKPKLNYLEEWRILGRALRLEIRGNTSLGSKIAAKECVRFRRFSTNSPHLWATKFIEGLAIKSSGNERLNIGSYRIVCQNSNFAAMKDYFISNIFEKHQNYTLSAIDDFFDCYSELSQVLFLVSNLQEIKDGYSVTSSNFKKTKMLYGILYETIGSLFEFLSILNNTLVGRPYDQFLTMDLCKYKQTDKAGRARNFELNGNLSWFAGEYDNRIRNATHHGSASFNFHDQKITLNQKNDRSDTPLIMSYTQYLVACCRIFIRLISIYRLEISFALSL